jgi:hypothetical protein
MFVTSEYIMKGSKVATWLDDFFCIDGYSQNILLSLNYFTSGSPILSELRQIRSNANVYNELHEPPAESYTAGMPFQAGVRQPNPTNSPRARIIRGLESALLSHGRPTKKPKRKRSPPYERNVSFFLPHTAPFLPPIQPQTPP